MQNYNRVKKSKLCIIGISQYGQNNSSSSISSAAGKPQMEHSHFGIPDI